MCSVFILCLFLYVSSSGVGYDLLMRRFLSNVSLEVYALGLVGNREDNLVLTRIFKSFLQYRTLFRILRKSCNTKYCSHHPAFTFKCKVKKPEQLFGK